MNGSESFYQRALQVIPGGVNSPVRAFGAVGGTPVFVTGGRGARITTADGDELVDFCGSWGPLLLGHAHPAVVEAVRAAAARGTTFGTATPGEVEFAERLCHAVPSMDQVRLVNSGTEATMTALRLARGFTGCRKILKFDGCYHGHVDDLLVSAGSGLLTGGIASSAGVAYRVSEEVLVAPYNDIAAVEQIMAEYTDQLAAIIVEPVAGNMGLVPPQKGFLEALRSMADDSGALLIFDEVITGFRLAPTTYGCIAGITPDLTCLGKIIGGGLPIGAVGGRREVMQCLAPVGKVYQAGTLSGNPIAVAAGRAMLKQLTAKPPYMHIEKLARRLVDGVASAARRAGIPVCPAVRGGMFTLFFQTGPVHNLNDARRSDTAAYAHFFHAMLQRGIYLPPSQFEVSFISAAHSEDNIDAFVAAAGQALAEPV